MKIKTNIGEPLSVDLENRTIVHWITTVAVDADGESVIPEGIQLDRFLNNPVVFKDHKYSLEDQIGRCLNLDVRAGIGIIATTQFKKAVPDILWEAYSTGFTKGWSVGYTEPVKEGIKVVRCQLLEYSAVALPNNPETLTFLRSKGFIAPKKSRIIVPKKTIIGALNKPRCNCKKGNKL